MSNLWKLKTHVLLLPLAIILSLVGISHSQGTIQIPDIDKTLSFNEGPQRNTLVVGDVDGSDINPTDVPIPTIDAHIVISVPDSYPNITVTKLSDTFNGITTFFVQDSKITQEGVDAGLGSLNGTLIVNSGQNLPFTYDFTINLANDLNPDQCRLINQIDMSFTTGATGKVSDTAEIVGLFPVCPEDKTFTCAQINDLYEFNSISDFADAIENNPFLIGAPGSDSCCNQAGAQVTNIGRGGTTCNIVLTIDSMPFS